MPDRTISEDAYEFLEWFCANADFGPADGDVRIMMQERFEQETGRKVPDEYVYE